MDKEKKLIEMYLKYLLSSGCCNIDYDIGSAETLSNVVENYFDEVDVSDEVKDNLIENVLDEVNIINYELTINFEYEYKGEKHWFNDMI